MIVTPEGLNVFPEDVEHALNAQPGVRDRRSSAPAPRDRPRSACTRCCVLSRHRRGRGRARGQRRSSATTRRCAPRRSGRASELPRTEGTRKLKRRELKAVAVRCSRRTAEGRALRNRDVRWRPCSRVSRRAARSHRRRPSMPARPQLARTGRADDGARRGVPGHHRRDALRSADDRRRPRGADPTARPARRRLGHASQSPSTSPRGIAPCPRGRCAARACPPGFSRSAASSRASTSGGSSTSNSCQDR